MLKGLTFLTVKIWVTAAEALKQIIEFVFTGAVPVKSERDRILFEIMNTYRELPIWFGKTNAENRTPAARRRALPRKCGSNIYRAKQVWFELNSGAHPGFNGSLRFEKCERLYRSLVSGDNFTPAILPEKKTKGRPRGAVSRFKKEEKKAA